LKPAIKRALQNGKSTRDADLDEAIFKYNLMQTGTSLTLYDINNYELEMIPFINSVKNEIEQKEIKKMMQNMPKPKKR